MTACFHTADVTCPNCDYFAAARDYFADKTVTRAYLIDSASETCSKLYCPRCHEPGRPIVLPLPPGQAPVALCIECLGNEYAGLRAENVVLKRDAKRDAKLGAAVREALDGFDFAYDATVLDRVLEIEAHARVLGVHFFYSSQGVMLAIARVLRGEE